MVAFPSSFISKSPLPKSRPSWFLKGIISEIACCRFAPGPASAGPSGFFWLSDRIAFISSRTERICSSLDRSCFECLVGGSPWSVTSSPPGRSLFREGAVLLGGSLVLSFSPGPFDRATSSENTMMSSLSQERLLQIT